MFKYSNDYPASKIPWSLSDAGILGPLFDLGRTEGITCFYFVFFSAFLLDDYCIVVYLRCQHFGTHDIIMSVTSTSISSTLWMMVSLRLHAWWKTIPVAVPLPSKHADGNPTIGATLGQRTNVRLPQHRANAGKF